MITHLHQFFAYRGQEEDRKQVNDNCWPYKVFVAKISKHLHNTLQ